MRAWHLSLLLSCNFFNDSMFVAYPYIVMWAKLTFHLFCLHYAEGCAVWVHVAMRPEQFGNDLSDQLHVNYKNDLLLPIACCNLLCYFRESFHFSCSCDGSRSLWGAPSTITCDSSLGYPSLPVQHMLSQSCCPIFHNNSWSLTIFNFVI